MTGVFPSASALSAFLLTYLLHSSFAALLAGLVARWGKATSPHVRMLIWKLALTGPIVTSLAVTTLPIPHIGIRWQISGGESERLLEADEALALRSGDAFDRQFGSGEELEFAAISDPMVASEPAPSIETDLSSSAPWLTTLRLISSGAVWPLLNIGWVVFGFVGMGGLFLQWKRLAQLRRGGGAVTDEALLGTLRRLRRRANIRRPVALLESRRDDGPLTAGIRRPFILIPRLFLNSLTRWEKHALLAHELAHVAHRDALWNLITHGVCHLFFFQPLNLLLRRRLQIEMEFAADWRAARMLQEPVGLARCLARLGEWMATSSSHPVRSQNLASGMASFRSILGRRVERLLSVDLEAKEASPAQRTILMTLGMAAMLLAVAIVPRAAADPPPETNSPHRNEAMRKPLTTLALLAGMAMPLLAEDDAKPQETPAAATELKTVPDRLPDGIKNFNGMLVGRLAKKDIETGSFVVHVDAVPRVWRNSNAENPKSIVGKNVEVDGVFGKWLDVLLVMRTGETLEFEAKHDGGDQLTFPGELLRKVAPYKAEDYPQLPESFRGFKGAVVAEVIKKDVETLELIVKVDRVRDVWKESRADQPQSIEGKSMMVAGFWQRKDDFHKLSVGDRIELGLQHIGQRSDHMSVAEFVRKAESGSPEMKARMQRKEQASDSASTHPFAGFRGMLVGRIVRKDVERGTFAIEVDAVPRVWNNNQAKAPKELIGKQVAFGGVVGRMLDVLVVARQGQTIAAGAAHDGGDEMRVLEMLRTVAPVEPGDYPQLPEAFRGFQGAAVGTVVKKDPQIFELIVKVDHVAKSWSKSRAKDPRSIVGKPVMLTGFWQRKDDFHQIEVGDAIEFGVTHPQPRSDHLQVAEFIRKRDGQGNPATNE